MKIKYLILAILIGLIIIHSSHADAQIIQEVGLRYNNTISTNGLFDWSPNAAGKLLELKYDLSPWGHATGVTKNFYTEVAVGNYYPTDFLNGAAQHVAEASPGVQVQAGPVLAKLSQGISTMPNAEFVTHLSLNVVDKSGITMGLERTHFSSGSSSGLDFTGLNIGFRF